MNGEEVTVVTGDRESEDAAWERPLVELDAWDEAEGRNEFEGLIAFEVVEVDGSAREGKLIDEFISCEVSSLKSSLVDTVVARL